MHINCVNENGLLKCKTENKTNLFSLAALRPLSVKSVEHRADEMRFWPGFSACSMHVRYKTLYIYTL